MSLPVAVLAGGLATRLRPLSDRIPKALIEVAGRPFAVHQVELLRDHGITDVVFLVGHLGAAVRDALGQDAVRGVRIRYVFDGPRLLGTGGAVRRALPVLGDPFFVLYGDSYLECDYAAIGSAFLASDKNALMTVYRNDDRFDRSNVLYRDGRILRYDKEDRTADMRHIDYGLCAFRKAAFADSGDTERFDLAGVLQQCLADGDLMAVEVGARFFEIGSTEGLEETREYLAGKGVSRR